MAVEEIAVLGGGNGAFTTAGDMSLAGKRVRMWTAFPQEFEELFETRTVQVEGFGRTGKAKIDLVTKDLGEAVKGARIIFSPSPAFSQEEIAERLGPYLEDGQIIVLSPGSMGSYLFGRVLKKNNSWRDITVAEPGTLPYLTRKTSPTGVLVSGHAVRLPVGVFPAMKTGETINIPDAYADSRFNPEVDKKTGFHTRSILCMPLRNKDGEIIGVSQVLNKKGGPFTERDERRLAAFSAEASIALENAKLFEDILNMKNYNESMLECMSNGVISLDADRAIVKCNAATLRILQKQDIHALLRTSVVDLFSETNPWILESIDKVMTTMKKLALLF